MLCGFQKKIVSVECLCTNPNCGASVKIPAEKIKSSYVTGEEKIFCPFCQSDLSEQLQDSAKSVFEYEHSISMMNSLSACGSARFYLE